MHKLEPVDNLSFIENGLLHIQFELSRNKPSYFRIARESHLILYRSMIEALKGSANLAVTRRPRKNRSHKYKRGNKPLQEIHKVAVNDCMVAWRFSIPEICDEPQIDTNDAAEIQQPGGDDYLISFYDALAMIQSECFMHQFVHSTLVPVSDGEMNILEWLHEYIRNEYEHFVPKSYGAPATDLSSAASLCLRLSSQLLFKSKNVMFRSVPEAELKTLFENVTQELRSHSENQS
jgi:hypothetical protein